jgi:hypothetical protein
MLLSPLSRHFIKHELAFRPYRGNGLALPLQSENGTLDVCSVLQDALEKGKARLTIGTQDVVQLTKVEVRKKSKLAILLFRRSDPDASTPVFENRKTNKLRRPEKLAEEAIAVSAHLIVDLDPLPREYPTYRAVLEEVPGLGRTYIQGVIHDVVREVKYSYTDHRGDEKETYTLASLQGVPSQTLHGALNKRGIPYVALIRPATLKGLDTEGLIAARDERLTLRVLAEPQDTLRILKKIKVWAKGDWADVRVQIGLPDDRSKWVSIAREADAADVLFVASEKISLDSPVDPCTDKINEEFITKTQKMFKAQKKAAE